MPDQVVDYSWGRPLPFPGSIVAAGYVGAMRYLCAELSAKRIQPAEAQALDAAGLGYGLVYEDEAAAPLQGFARGQQNAARAEAQAAAIGFPGDRPIYHAVDFDVQPSQYPALDAYMQGVRSVNPGRPFGWYGHYRLCEHYGPSGVYLWQCAAWSGNGQGSGGSIGGRRLSRHARLFQRVGYVLGNTCDLNDVLDPDWGQHNYQGGDMPLDNDDKAFIAQAAHDGAVAALRENVRPVVLKVSDNEQYLWALGGVPVLAGAPQIATVGNLMGDPQVIDVNAGFVAQMRLGLGGVSANVDVNQLATVLAAQLGPAQAQALLDAMAARLAS